MPGPYSTKEAAQALLRVLRQTYGADLPDDAWGEIDNFLCDAHFAGVSEAQGKDLSWNYDSV